MILCFFVTDLHGQLERYKKLFRRIELEKPSAVFLGGDLMPSGLFSMTSNDLLVQDFMNEIMIGGFSDLKAKLGKQYPRVFLILGNDDGRIEENEFIKAESKHIWEYIHNKKTILQEFSVYGYAYVPPTPFQLKDWERYDVSRYVDPGCVSPEEGWRTVQIPSNRIRYSTIQEDLEKLTGNENLSKSVFLFHTPPYKTGLDRIADEGRMIEHVPLDIHVGSIAVKKFIEKKQPYITLHGHVHESARITGSWKERIGNTYAISAAHDGHELALVSFNLRNPQNSRRELI